MRAASRWVARKGHPKMVDEQGKPHAGHGLVVRRLIEDTGITEDQARELIGFIGAQNWPSLVRQAHVLKRKP